MMEFEKFLQKLQQEEGVASPLQLIAKWDSSLVQEIEKDFRAAVVASGLIGQSCPINPKSTNQAIGNKLADFVSGDTKLKLSLYSIVVKIDKTISHGYPDRILIRNSDSLRIALEIKATSTWNPKDTKSKSALVINRTLEINFSASCLSSPFDNCV